MTQTRDCTFEYFEPGPGIARSEYANHCQILLSDSTTSGRWQMWAAAMGGRVVSTPPSR
ncbi:MAG TPA: hypothetical protein VME46_22120 [Acidimicrobiales bacterium]|nr:hypothetical protein [Acidimicrobiales bacterium]